MRSVLVWTVAWLGVLVAGAHAADTVGTVEVSEASAIQPGRVAYVDPTRRKIVEITPDGKPTWEYPVPADVIGDGDLGHEADIEWLAASDHFLFVVPMAGIFEVDRDKHIVWSYKTKYVTHDADRLPNGNTIFVYGADKDDDPTVTEVDPSGKVVFQWFARDHLDKAERHESPGEAQYSFAHANAVQRRANGRTMVSLRNFFRFVVLNGDAIVKQSQQIPFVHDPVIRPKVIYFAAHGKDASALIRVAGGQRTQLFLDETGQWVLLRTVEPLRNGNVLITGAQRIGQVDPTGRLVWSILLDGFPVFDAKESVRRAEAARQRGMGGPSQFGGGQQSNFSRSNKRAALYKAAWVYK